MSECRPSFHFLRGQEEPESFYVNFCRFLNSASWIKHSCGLFMNRPPVSELWLSSDPESSFLTWPQTIRAGSRYLLRELSTISSAKDTSPEHVSKTSGTKFGHSESPHRPGMWSLLNPRGAGPWGKRLRANSFLANCEAMLDSSSRYGNSEWYPVDNKGWEPKSDPESGVFMQLFTLSVRISSDQRQS